MRTRLLKVMVLLGCPFLALLDLPPAQAAQLPELLAPRAGALRPDPEPWPADPFAGNGPHAPRKTAATARSAKAPKALVLQGILIGDHGRYALFAGQTATVGETVEGSRVVQIDRDRVELESTAGRQVLRVFPGKDRF